MAFNEIDRQEREWQDRSRVAQTEATEAFSRLLCLAEAHDSGQIRTIAKFIASTFDSSTFPFDLFDLRTVDVNISDDMLICLDALRWGKADLYKLVPDGHQRVLDVCAAWGIKWPEAN